MTNAERSIRFETALEIVQRVYSDYCNDESKTREQARAFCDFIIDMNKFSSVLRKEAENFIYE